MSITVTPGPKVVVRDANHVHPYARPGSRHICLPGPAWSSDHGVLWSPNPPEGFHPNGPITLSGEQAATYTDANTILVLHRTLMDSREKGWYRMGCRRSRDHGKTWETFHAMVHLPNAKRLPTDNGKFEDSYLFHHGLVCTDDGQLMGTFYGADVGDDIPADGYTEDLGNIKTRLRVVFSKDGGDRWGDSVTVGPYNKMQGRSADPDPRKARVVSNCPLVSLEGINEAAMCRVSWSGGDYWIVARSGSRKSIRQAVTPYTPLYLMRCNSYYNGKHWSAPKALSLPGSDIHTVGSADPQLCSLPNGVLVLAYSAPDGYVTCFNVGNDDFAVSPIKVTNSDSDIGLCEAGFDTALVVYWDSTLPGTPIVAQPFKFERREHRGKSLLHVDTQPRVVRAGNSARLFWSSQGLKSLSVDGIEVPTMGTLENGTGILHQDTVFRFESPDTPPYKHIVKVVP